MKMKPLYFVLLLSLSFGVLASDEEDEEEEEEATTEVVKPAPAAKTVAKKEHAQKVEAKKEKVNAFVKAVNARKADSDAKQGNDLIDED